MTNGQKVIKQIDLDVEKEINETHENFKFTDLILLFSIIGSCIGTIIAFNTTDIINEFSKHIINPLIDLTIGQILPFSSLKFTIHGNTFSFGKILYELSSFFALLGLIYIGFKYIFKELIHSAISYKYTHTVKVRKQNDEIIKTLHSINNKLSGDHSEIPDQLNQINRSIITTGEQNNQYIPYPYGN